MRCNSKMEPSGVPAGTRSAVTDNSATVIVAPAGISPKSNLISACIRAGFPLSAAARLIAPAPSMAAPVLYVGKNSKRVVSALTGTTMVAPRAIPLTLMIAAARYFFTFILAVGPAAHTPYHAWQEALLDLYVLPPLGSPRLLNSLSCAPSPAQNPRVADA